MANRRTTDYSMATPVVSNSLRANVGITWSMEVYRMLKERMAKIARE
jgi:VanZ family protein